MFGEGSLFCFACDVLLVVSSEHRRNAIHNSSISHWSHSSRFAIVGVHCLCARLFKSGITSNTHSHVVVLLCSLWQTTALKRNLPRNMLPCHCHSIARTVSSELSCLHCLRLSLFTVGVKSNTHSQAALPVCSVLSPTVVGCSAAPATETFLGTSISNKWPARRRTLLVCVSLQSRSYSPNAFANGSRCCRVLPSTVVHRPATSTTKTLLGADYHCTNTYNKSLGHRSTLLVYVFLYKVCATSKTHSQTKFPVAAYCHCTSIYNKSFGCRLTLLVCVFLYKVCATSKTNSQTKLPVAAYCHRLSSNALPRQQPKPN